MSLLHEAVIFLAAAVVAVPLARWLGLGAVIGYLAAGVAIGPAGLGLVGGVHEVMHLAEFGVVLLLFIIGLELQPSRLWALRRPIFVNGTAQIGLSAIPIAAIAYFAGLSPMPAVLIGIVLALSSTAFALQALAEREELTTHHGRAAFAILLMQDLAVIPLLALIPVLAPGGGEAFDPLDLIKTVAVIVAVIVGGRTLLRPVLRMVSASRTNEIFTAMALLVVSGTALAMEWAGLSMALGAFLAGVLLADSEYRHALEADIEPFKGLLLGLFFISVGMGVDLRLLVDEPAPILSIAIGLVLIKAGVLWTVGRLAGLDRSSARNLAIALSQGGEFAFVLFAVMADVALLDAQVMSQLIVAVTLSMGLTPLLFLINDHWWLRWFPHTRKPFDHIESSHHRVIVAGFGRFGQIIGRVLRARGIAFTALELDSDQVDFVRRFGNRTYYGDASRSELLRAAGVEQAELFVLAVQDEAASLRIARAVRELAPELRIIARARNRQHAYKLMELGIRDVVRDTFDSSLRAAGNVLRGLGFSEGQARFTTETFAAKDEERLFEAFGSHDDLDKMIELAQRSASELEKLFAEEHPKDGRQS